MNISNFRSSQSRKQIDYQDSVLGKLDFLHDQNQNLSDSLLNKIAERERAPIYEVGTITYDKRFTIKSKSKGNTPLDLSLDNFFGSSPQTVMKDNKKIINYSSILYDNTKTKYYLKLFTKNSI